MNTRPPYMDWHIPFKQGEVTLRESRTSLACVGARQQAIPYIVRLLENPSYHIPGITLFHGAVTLDQHDAIHILLGRGLLPEDEAFAIGFTMGSSRRVSSLEARAFGWISSHCYPSSYRFGKDVLDIFYDAIRLAAISRCRPLHEQDYEALLDLPLAAVRRRLGIEPELLLAYYAVEKQRYPDSRASQRLLNEYPAGLRTKCTSPVAA